MMKKVSRRSFLQACSEAAAPAPLTACGGGKAESKTADAHEAVTFMAPYKEIEAFIEQVHSVYPEVNIEVVPYSGDNTTTCLQNMFAAGDLPDVCTLTYYDPRIDLVSDKLLDLSGYDFTDNYVESRLQDVFDNGAIYLLPSTYNCYGITYNKTLLKKYGWPAPVPQPVVQAPLPAAVNRPSGQSRHTARRVARRGHRCSPAPGHWPGRHGR